MSYPESVDRINLQAPLGGNNLHMRRVEAEEAEEGAKLVKFITRFGVPALIVAGALAIAGCGEDQSETAPVADYCLSAPLEVGETGADDVKYRLFENPGGVMSDEYKVFVNGDSYDGGVVQHGDEIKFCLTRDLYKLAQPQLDPSAK